MKRYEEAMVTTPEVSRVRGMPNYVVWGGVNYADGWAVVASFLSFEDAKEFAFSIANNVKFL